MFLQNQQHGKQITHSKGSHADVHVLYVKCVNYNSFVVRMFKLHSVNCSINEHDDDDDDEDECLCSSSVLRPSMPMNINVFNIHAVLLPVINPVQHDYISVIGSSHEEIT